MDFEQIEDPVSFSYALLATVHKTKDYTLLKTYATRIWGMYCDSPRSRDWTYEQLRDRKERIVSIIVDAIIDGNFDRLQEQVEQSLLPFCSKVSEECARLGVAFDKIPLTVRSPLPYFAKLIDDDNLDLYVAHQARVCDFHRARYHCGEVCAEKIMTYIGFSEGNVHYYVTGAFYYKNKKTLRFLIANGVRLEPFFLGFIIPDEEETPTANSFRAYFAEGLLNPTEEEWQTLKRRNPVLYDGLRCDV